MKICRYLIRGEKEAQFGMLETDGLETDGLDNNWLVPLNFTDISKAPKTKSEVLTRDTKISLSEVQLLPPVSPSKIVCVGRNYADHAKELGNEVPSEPLLFLKAPSSLITNNEIIKTPAQSIQVEHEGELAVIIKRTTKNIAPDEDPLDYVWGYACLNDVTARDLQRRDIQFTRAKSFDTFCPLGHFIETELNPSQLNLTVRVNDEIKQQGNTSSMVFPVNDLIRYISQQMTLLPGDVLATGTPSGVSRLVAGDVCTIEIEGIGILQNPVR